MARTGAALVRHGDDLEPYAARINQALGKTIEAIFETGRLLLEARDKLEHGKWERLFKDRHVPIGVITARRFIEIYKRREQLTNHSKLNDLPPSYTTLYELARLPDDTLEWAHEQKKISADLKGEDIKRIRQEYDGAELPPPKAAAVRELPPAFRETARITDVLRPAYVLSEEWPDTKPLDDLIHEVRSLLTFLERLEEKRRALST